MTRDEWAAQLAARAAEAEQLGSLAPVATIYRVVLAELAEVDGLATRTADTLLTLDEVAARLQVPKRWLTDHREELPFLRRLTPGGTVRVSEVALTRWLATRAP